MQKIFFFKNSHGSFDPHDHMVAPPLRKNLLKPLETATTRICKLPQLQPLRLNQSCPKTPNLYYC